MRIAAVLMMIVAQLVPAPAFARERLLQPTDDWSLRGQDEYCSLTRNFVDPQGEGIRLQLQGFGPSAFLKFTMVGEGLPLSDGRRGVARFKVRFKPDPEWREIFGTTGFVGEVDALTFSANLATAREAERMQRAWQDGAAPADDWSSAMLGRAAEVDQLALAYPARDDTVLQLGAMAEPIRQLEDCTKELVRKWGYDPAGYAGLRRQALLVNAPEIANAVLRAMLDADVGHNDAIHVRMDVDERGVAAGCTVQQPRRGTEVEALICDTVRATARFEPAIDHNGDPIRVPYVTAVAFAIG